MALRDSKFAPIAFWLAFLALGFFTSFAGPAKGPGKGDIVAERETAADKSARD